MASPSTATTAPPWSDLLPELLGRIAAFCRRPTDRASFRAACSPWRSAARRHCPPMPLLPWVVLPDGSFLTLSDGDRDLPSAVLPYGFFVKPFGGGPHRLPLPENTACVGSTGSWLALCHTLNSHTLLLHNPFSSMTVPLPDVEAIGARAPPRVFEALKVLMRSTADDIVAVLTRSCSCPFILSSPAKGSWTPEPYAPPFMYIIDVAFLGDKLYGITKAEDLFSFDLTSPHDGQIPKATDAKRVIRHPLDYSGYDVAGWSDIEDEDNQIEEDGLSDSDSYSSDNCYELDSDNEELLINQVPASVDCWFDEDGPSPVDITTIRYLVESCGKMVMVRRQLRIPDDLPRYTRKVEVFEADMDAGVWVPVSDGLGDGGQAIFIGKRFSKCVSTCLYGEGALHDDAIYFMDTGEVFYLRSGTIGPALWLFPPDFCGCHLVVSSRLLVAGIKNNRMVK
ncbi:hypothetical protein ACP70R_014696 [Stipagrostis hirtigluma subsp. patula]